jgi:hypothetical protein
VKDHPEAQIFINGTEHGKGTIAELFKRKDSLTVEVREPGCEPKTQTIHRTLRTGSFILSCVVWVLVGGIVDLSTGAAYKPDHKHDPSIKKIDFKEFEFTIDYTGCTAKKQ